MSVNQECLEEEILKGLVKGDYEPKKYSIKSKVTCVKNT